MNWEQLKTFVNSLTEEQLKQEVKVLDDLRTYPIDSVELTTEERYWNGCHYVPESDFEGWKMELDYDDVLPIGSIRMSVGYNHITRK